MYVYPVSSNNKYSSTNLFQKLIFFSEFYYFLFLNQNKYYLVLSITKLLQHLNSANKSIFLS